VVVVVVVVESIELAMASGNSNHKSCDLLRVGLKDLNIFFILTSDDGGAVLFFFGKKG
jgi:hypothetical protein